MTSDIATAITAASVFLRAHADRSSAPTRKAYLKTPLKVLGCGVPVVNAAAQTVRRAHPAPDPAVLPDALEDLWSSMVHEDRLLAIALAAYYHRQFDPRQVDTLFGRWLGDCQSWDHVDTLSTRVVGRIALRDAKAWPVIGRWAEDPWMWRRRAAVLSHLPAIRQRKLRQDLFRATCERLIGDPEVFIRKAIGWALRELSIKDLALAEAMVLELGPQAASLTLREAVRRMPADRREWLLSEIAARR